MNGHKRGIVEGGPLRAKRWHIDAGAIPAGGLKGHEKAGSEELVELALLLDLQQCEQFEVLFHIRPLGQRRLHMKGRVVARIVQACIVTLDPIATHLDVPIDCEFWPEEQLAPPGAEVVIDPAMAEPPEPITGGKLEIGRAAYEVLAVNIDPYPSKPGAKFDWESEHSPERPGAFADLARLKGKRQTPEA